MNPVTIFTGKHLEVTLSDGSVDRHPFSHWSTEEELVIYGPDGELKAVYAKDTWAKAVVTGSDEEAEDG